MITKRYPGADGPRAKDADAFIGIQSTDTDPIIGRIQIAGLRRPTPTQRFQMANRLTFSIFALSWGNFRRMSTDPDERTTALLRVRVLYRDDLADRLSAYLERRSTQVNTASS